MFSFLKKKEKKIVFNLSKSPILPFNETMSITYFQFNSIQGEIIITLVNNIISINHTGRNFSFLIGFN